MDLDQCPQAYQHSYLEIPIAVHHEDLNVLADIAKMSKTLSVRLLSDSWEDLELDDLVSTLGKLYTVAQAGNLFCDTVILLPFSADIISQENSSVQIIYHCSPQVRGNMIRSSKNLPQLPTREFFLKNPLAPQHKSEKPVRNFRNPRVSLGGTFDHLHAGHKILLTVAATLATEVVITGLADGPLIENKKFKEMMEPFQTRKANVDKFLSTINPCISSQVVTLLDVGGPTLEDPTITGLVVSQETENNAYLINQMRAKKNFPPLVITVVPLLANHPSLGADAQNKTSSTGIREALARRLHTEKNNNSQAQHQST